MPKKPSVVGALVLITGGARGVGAATAVLGSRVARRSVPRWVAPAWSTTAFVPERLHNLARAHHTRRSHPAHPAKRHRDRA